MHVRQTKTKNEVIKMNTIISELIGAVSQVIIFALIPFVWWLITARKKENFFKWIGIKTAKNNGSILKAFVITIIIMTVYVVSATFMTNKYAGDVTSAGSQFKGMGIKYIPVAFIYGLIRTGLSEEILFRGFLLKRLSSKLGFFFGNLIQAIAFGLIHGISFGMATGNASVTVVLTVLPGIVGFLFGWLNEKKCSGSIVPSWLIHGIANTITTCITL